MCVLCQMNRPAALTRAERRDIALRMAERTGLSDYERGVIHWLLRVESEAKDRHHVNTPGL